MAAETSKTLDRGLRVLEVLAAHPHGLTATELAAEVGANRTVVYRLASTLEQHGLARRDAAGRLYLGLAVLDLVRGLQPVLREIATPVLRALADELGATAHLTVADGGEALAVAVVEPSWTDFHVAYRVGARHPLDQGAAGRAILLGRALAGAQRTAQSTAQSQPPGVHGGSARGDGAYSSSAGVDGASPGVVETVGELQPGARGLASPVLGVEGLDASVGIVTLGELDVATSGPRVRAAAATLARRLS